MGLSRRHARPSCPLSARPIRQSRYSRADGSSSAGALNAEIPKSKNAKLCQHTNLLLSHSMELPHMYGFINTPPTYRHTSRTHKILPEHHQRRIATLSRTHDQSIANLSSVHHDTMPEQRWTIDKTSPTHRQHITNLSPNEHQHKTTNRKNIAKIIANTWLEHQLSPKYF